MFAPSGQPRTCLAASLTELGARLKIGERSIDTLELQIDARTIHALEIGTDSSAGSRGARRRPRPSCARRYEQLAENAIELEVDGLRILVASLADIIRSKEIADRPKDREALEELRSLRDAGGSD